MPYKIVDSDKLDSKLTELADKLRAKNGTTEGLDFYAGDFSKATDNIPAPKPEQEKTLEVTENGDHEAIPDEGKVLSKTTVKVAVPIKEEQKEDLKITENGSYKLLPDENSLFSEVDLEVDVQDTFYNTFWDNYQNNGERTAYTSAFHGEGWTDETFKPKYNLIPINGQNMFYGSGIVDLVGCLERQNVTFDFSKCDYMPSIFHNCRNLISIPPIDCSSLTRAGNQSIFRDCIKLESVTLLNCQDYDYHVTYNIFNMMFLGCNALKHLTITGLICASISVSQCSDFTVESAKNVLLCLKNYKGTADEYKPTVSFHPNTLVLLEAEGATAPGDITWAEYANLKGWNM